jgi:homoserine kinase type II
VVELDRGSYCVLPWLPGHHLAGPDLSLDQAHHLGTVVGRIHHVLNQLDPAIGLPPATSRPTAPVVHPQAAIARARRYQAAAQVRGDPFDLAVIDLLNQRLALINEHADIRPVTDQPRGPYGWTHGDLQYLHWASRLLEMLLSVRIGRSARRSSWRLGWCRG